MWLPGLILTEMQCVVSGSDPRVRKDTGGIDSARSEVCGFVHMVGCPGLHPRFSLMGQGCVRQVVRSSWGEVARDSPHYLCNCFINLEVSPMEIGLFE